MADFGLTGFGAYIPRLRLERAAIAQAHAWMAPHLKAGAKGARAFCNWDEDAITMAVEAARDALHGQAQPFDVLMLASTTSPFANLQGAGIVAGALGAPAATEALDLGGSPRAGLSALAQALRARRPALVIGAERPNAKPASAQEMTYGAGASALLLGAGRAIAVLRGAGVHGAQLVDHFRAAGADHDYYWEERWIRDEGYLKSVPAAARAALKDAQAAPSDITHFAFAAPQRGIAEAVAKAIGLNTAPTRDLQDGCGYTGAAHPLLLLADVLERAKPGELILVAGFGQGAEALVLETTDAISDARPRRGVSGALAQALPTQAYLRMLSFYGGVDLEWGMRAEKSGKTALTEQYRSSAQTGAFMAGRCPACGAVQFPQHQYCVGPDCAAPARAFEQLSLVDAPSRVLTYTADWLSYHPAPPLYVGFAQYDNGARVLTEITDVGEAGIDVGAPLQNVFRIKEIDRQRGYRRYFWKAAPLMGDR